MKFLPLTFLSVLASSLSFFVAGDSNGIPECTHGKLYISSRNSTTVHVYDLNRSLQSMYNEANVTLPPSATNELTFDTSSDSTYVAVVYRGTIDVRFMNAVVNWVHTGFSQLDHGDHYHIAYGPPQLMTSSAMFCGRPVHMTRNHGKIGLFCDGSYDAVPQVNATVLVIDESKLGSNTSPVVHNTSLLGSHHGIAIPVDEDHIMYTLPVPDRVNRTPNGTLFSAPWTIQITDYNGNVLHGITDTSNKDLHCSGHHGTATKGDTFAFACDGNHGGVLIVNYNQPSKTYSSRALFYPPEFAGHRSSSLTSHDKSPYVIGNFGLGAANYLIGFEMTDSAPMTNSSLLPLSARQCAFKYEKSDGDYILSFFPNGTLSVLTYDRVSSWKLIAQVAVVPGMTACTQATFVPGHLQAFVMSYTTNTLYAIKLDKVQSGVMIVTTTSLPYTPLSAIVVGAPDLYACGLKPKTLVATVGPSASPSMSPLSKSSLKPSVTPTKAPITPTTEEREPCGLFGLSIFCFGAGECGIFRRLFNMGGC